MSQLTHLDEQGNANMVDITPKPETLRKATAQAVVYMQAHTLAMITSNKSKKGDVLAVARIAGIQAAKRCSELIPLCHSLLLTSVKIDFKVDNECHCLKILATCQVTGQTGVEMEALTAASVASLTVYDMCKAVDKSMTISDIHLLEKTGGKSNYRRNTCDSKQKATDE